MQPPPHLPLVPPVPVPHPTAPPEFRILTVVPTAACLPKVGQTRGAPVWRNFREHSCSRCGCRENNNELIVASDEARNRWSRIRPYSIVPHPRIEKDGVQVRMDGSKTTLADCSPSGKQCVVQYLLQRTRRPISSDVFPPLPIGQSRHAAARTRLGASTPRPVGKAHTSRRGCKTIVVSSAFAPFQRSSADDSSSVARGEPTRALSFSEESEAAHTERRHNASHGRAEEPKRDDVMSTGRCFEFKERWWIGSCGIQVGSRASSAAISESSTVIFASTTSAYDVEGS
ncbi:hypothetical protein LXA43DRAFT_1061507 [Ganoderma leucocontextum]|nr:hypothetical protein LXA43DRAFT_1061507 [Ganoderma leucocontextum]